MKSSVQLYDFEFLKQVYNSDKEIIGQISKIFIENIPRYIQDLEQASLAQDWSAVSFTAHKIKSSIKLFNIHLIIDEVVEIEHRAKTVTALDEIPVMITHVTTVLKQVEAEMKYETSGNA